jgi:hypothetical protein
LLIAKSRCSRLTIHITHLFRGMKRILRRIKNLLLYILIEGAFNLVVLAVLLALCKIIPSFAAMILIPILLMYWLIVLSIKSGEISFFRKTYSISEVHMFSATATAWFCLPLLMVVIPFGSDRNWLDKPAFWLTFFATPIIIYLSFVVLNPFLRKSK